MIRAREMQYDFPSHSYKFTICKQCRHLLTLLSFPASSFIFCIFNSLSLSSYKSKNLSV